MFLAPNPQVDSDAVCARLEELLLREAAPTAIEVKMLERDIAKLFRTTQPEWGWIAKSGLAAVLWDQESALKIAEDAVAAVGRHPSMLANLAVGLRHINLLEEALRFSADAHRAEPLEFSLLAPYLVDLINLGRVSDAKASLKSFFDRLGVVQAERHSEAKDAQHLICGILTGLASAGVSEDELQQEIEAAMAVVTEHRIRYDVVNYRVSHDRDTGSHQLLVDISFYGSFEDALRLGATLAPRLATFEHWNPAKLVVDFTQRERERANITA